MTKPTIRVDKPADGDPIGEGAERIRETRQAIYDVFPIGPEDLDNSKVQGYWPAGSMTGGQDPEVESGVKEPYDDYQDRAFLIGDATTNWDYTIPEGKNALSIGLDADSIITVPETSDWINIEKDDVVHVKYLRDLNDVDTGVTGAINGQALIYDESISLWKAGTPAAGPDGPVGPDGNDGADGADGKSAYELAVENGFVGTEAEWLDSLKGEDGTDGIIGVDGVDGKGWTDGLYNPDTGIITFESDDGLGFTTEDLRGEDGQPGPGFEYKGNVASIGALPGGATIGDAYFVEDVGELYAWGEDGVWHSLGAIHGPEGEQGHGWASGVYDEATGVVTFTGDSDSGFLTFSTEDLRAPAPDTSVYPDKEYIDNADGLLQDQIDVIKGDVSNNATDISTNAGNISTNAGNISTNAGNISQNAIDIGLLDGRVTVNEGDISTNASDIAKNVVDITQNRNDISSINTKITPDSADTIFTAVDLGNGKFGTTWAPNDHDGGVLLDNAESWEHAQYNTLVDADIQSDGTAMPRAMLGSIQVSPNQKISPSSGGAITICNVFGDAPTKVGIYANLLLDPVASYTFDVNNFLVNDIDEDKWLYVRLLSEGGKWKQVGSNYLGEPGGLGGGTETGVYREHDNASTEDQTITSDHNAIACGPIQLDHVVTIEDGAVWAIV